MYCQSPESTFTASILDITKHHDTYPAIDPLNFDLAGKVVLVTGASGGIGQAIAAGYAAGGASGIVLAARSSLDDVEVAVAKAATAANRNPPRILKVALDTTNLAQVAQAAAKIQNEFGRLDILVNNAGSLESIRLMGDQAPSDWWGTFEVNTQGTYLVTRALLPLLLASPEGSKSIVNVASSVAHTTLPMFSAYQVCSVSSAANWVN